MVDQEIMFQLSDARMVRERAKMILAPYGVAPSNLALCEVMSTWKGGRARIGKAAFKVARATLHQMLGDGGQIADPLLACRGMRHWAKLFKMGESARGWLIYYAVRDGRIASFEEGWDLDTQPCIEGGVVGAIETAHIYTKAGATVHRFCQAGAFVLGKERIRPETFVRLGQMTFHGSSPYAPKQSLNRALRAFRARKAAMAKRPQLANVSPVMRLETSLKAGNCLPGTENWIKRFKLDPKKTYSAALIESLDPLNEYVQRAVTVAYCNVAGA